MKKFLLTILIAIFGLFIFISSPVDASSYLADKTEVPVDLEVSGAEGLCQTEDGYIWIAQFSGLTRYDSRNYVTYKSFEENGKTYEIINVVHLRTKDNVLYIQTNENIYKYENNEFHYLDIQFDKADNIEINYSKNLLYVCTNKGLIVYDLTANTSSIVEGTDGKVVIDVELDEERDTFYYQLSDGLYDSSGNKVYEHPKILDIHKCKNELLIGQMNGEIYRYDLVNKKMLDTPYTVGDQVNKILYSEANGIIFVAGENNGIFCIDEKTGSYTVASNLGNKAQLVDLLEDYEGNLWVSSHYIGASGVSIITKNALLELLYDDLIWQALDTAPSNDRNVYAVDKHNGIVYIAATSGLFLYDTNTKKIIEDNPVMDALEQYAYDNGIIEIVDGKEVVHSNYKETRDVEVFNGKVYIAAYYVGLVEFDPETSDVKIYDVDYITNHNTKTEDTDLNHTNNMRSLRSFDDYLAIGFTKGIMKFDGTDFKIFWTGSNVLFINKTKDGNPIFDMTKDIKTIDNDFTAVTTVPTTKEVTGNRLKFLVDGDNIYYTLNSRLFKLDKDNKSTEVIIPHVKGSLVELSKVKVTIDGRTTYKYVICSQTQIYITDNLDVEQLTDYEFYDSSNGLQPIIANTSGYYDEEEQKYFFQSTNGIFVYDFNMTKEADVSVKIAMNSIEIDGNVVQGNNLKLSKDVYRVAFNVAILGFKPDKGYTIHYKLDGVDNEYITDNDNSLTISYTNLAGGDYSFHVYVTDSLGQESNEIQISFSIVKKLYETIWFWVLIVLLAIALIAAINLGIYFTRSKQAEKREAELKGVTIESIEAIARTIDAKDTYTNGHSIRVGHYSRIIAKELGMEGDELENLYYTALLHDIGKIGIPDAILNKPGRLTDEEFEIMKSHTTKGAKILKDISTIPNIVEGAKYHHERYGGGGYPEGLKGEEIPYIARIICCADCFDAMATRRVYKDPYPKEKIISEFERCKEIQFDPKMADVVIKLIEEGKLKAE